jgi:hypothetical protein
VLLLYDPLPADAVAAVAAFYERRGFRDGARGDETDELSTFLGLADPVGCCLRLGARLAGCLLPRWDLRDDEPAETAEQLLERLADYLACPDTNSAEVGRMVLRMALGAADDATRHAVLTRREADPAWLAGALAALHVLADYTTGCFGVPELTVADVVREVARIAPETFTGEID